MNRWQKAIRLMIEGDLITSNGKYYIHPKNNSVSLSGELGKIIVMHEIEPETISQYIGLCDKNGKKIFENDIIRVCTNGFDREVFETKVLFGARSGVQGFYLENGRMMFYWGQTDLKKMDDAEVIGNSFDNQKE